MTTKETLISLAKEKGFISELLSHTVWKYSYKEDLRYYLWMCELQKWLREIHLFHIEIFLGYDEDNIWYDYSLYKIAMNYEYKPLASSSNGETYEKCLQKGLLQALKLI